MHEVVGSILHADLDAFYASVEQRDDPTLAGRPVIVGGGVVLSASYEARRLGVRTAMGGRQALRLCPEAVVVPPRFSAYTAASRSVFAVFRNLTPVVEPMSIDEAFLDVSGLRRLRGPALPLAQELRERVRGEVGLPISVGVARTKYLAKVASALSKPDGLLVVPLDAERQFLHSLPVERLWGVGDTTAAKLHAARLHTVADIARWTVPDLAHVVGTGSARHLLALANGDDARRVTPGRRSRSVGAQHAMRCTRSTSQAQMVLMGLVDTVSRRPRHGGRTAATVTVRLRFADFRRSTSSRTLARPSDETSLFADTARELLAGRSDEVRRDGLTLVGVALTGLTDHGTQLLLPWTDGPDPHALDATLDAVRSRFGAAAVRRADQLGRP